MSFPGFGICYSLDNSGLTENQSIRAASVILILPSLQGAEMLKSLPIR